MVEASGTVGGNPSFSFSPSPVRTISIEGKTLEYQRLQPALTTAGEPRLPSMVFLHEGLGSLSMWGDFPQRVANHLECEVVVYSRYGYGGSTPFSAPLSTRYMHDEASLALPAFINALELDKPILLGHSDGASIALIHAGSYPQAVRAVVVMAPHLFVEDLTLESIAAITAHFQDSALPHKLARYHSDPVRSFQAWSDIWLHPDFRRWNIEALIPPIAVPILAIQGEDDEYGSFRQIERIAELRPGQPVSLVKLPACRHSPHRDQGAAVLQAVTNFVANLSV